MTEPTYRQQMLAHCMKLAEMDAAYAVTAAGWYEQNEPWILYGLEDRVEKDIAKSDSSSPATPSEKGVHASPSGAASLSSTPQRRRPATKAS
jgi:hypothetical protein